MNFDGGLRRRPQDENKVSSKSHPVALRRSTVQVSMRSSESLYPYTYDRHYICICKAHIISKSVPDYRYPYITNPYIAIES